MANEVYHTRFENPGISVHAATNNVGSFVAVPSLPAQVLQFSTPVTNVSAIFLGVGSTATTGINFSPGKVGDFLPITNANLYSWMSQTTGDKLELHALR
jgi:hypothetical protein